MVNPLAALLTGVVVLALGAVAAWPRHGLVARLRRLGRLSERVLLEDALEHLHDREYRGQAPSIESLAGALNVTTDRAFRLLERMEGLRFLQTAREGFRLTPEGRSYSRVISRSSTTTSAGRPVRCARRSVTASTTA